MKIFFLLISLLSLSFGNQLLACKNESTLYQISDRKGDSRLDFVTDMIYTGECQIIDSYQLVFKGDLISKIRYGNDTYFTLSYFIK